MLVKRTVEITQEDIENGVPGQCHTCPGARAIRRTFPELTILNVRTHGIDYSTRPEPKDKPFLWDVCGELAASVPPELYAFFLNFDLASHRQLARPCSFELELDL